MSEGGIAWRPGDELLKEYREKFDPDDKDPRSRLMLEVGINIRDSIADLVDAVDNVAKLLEVEEPAPEEDVDAETE